MKVTFVGTGTAVFSAERGASGLVVQAAGKTILLDAGAGTGYRLSRMKIDPRSLNAIFLTHYHLDHTGDLPSFLFAFNNPQYVPFERKLEIWGPEGIFHFMDGLSNLYGKWVDAVYYQRSVFEIDPGKVYEWQGLRIETIRVPHTPESIAYRITDLETGKSMVYSGDTDYSAELERFADNADLFVLECALSDPFQSEGHMSPHKVIRLLKNIRVTKTVLTHFYPVVDTVVAETNIASETNRNVVSGYDGMVVII